MTISTDSSRIDAYPAADGEMPAALRWQLRALRQDRAPSRELWPDIAARLEAHAPPSTGTSPRRRWITPVALAATLVIALAAGGLWRDGSTPGRSDAVDASTATLMQREAQGIARQYNAALSEVATAQSTSGTMQPVIEELDRNLILIHEALARDPGSPLLLDQLRRTYAHRLALAQRVAYS